MAQRTVHYAIAKELINKNIIKNEYEFIVGSIIPDSNNHTKEHYNITHYCTSKDDKRTIEYNRFLKDYKEKILEDDLYLGYYIHLITDYIYKNYIFNIKGLSKYKQEEDFLDRIYSDYRLLNKEIIEKYNLENIKIDKNIIPKEFNLSDISKFQEDFNLDFNTVCNNNKFNFLNYDMIYEIIDTTVDILYNHITKINYGDILLLDTCWW